MNAQLDSVRLAADDVDGRRENGKEISDAQARVKRIRDKGEALKDMCLTKVTLCTVILAVGPGVVHKRIRRRYPENAMGYLFGMVCVMVVVTIIEELWVFRGPHDVESRYREYDMVMAFLKSKDIAMSAAIMQSFFLFLVFLGLIIKESSRSQTFLWFGCASISVLPCVVVLCLACRHLFYRAEAHKESSKRYPGVRTEKNQYEPDDDPRPQPYKYELLLREFTETPDYSLLNFAAFPVWKDNSQLKLEKLLYAYFMHIPSPAVKFCYFASCSCEAFITSMRFVLHYLASCALAFVLLMPGCVPRKLGRRFEPGVTCFNERRRILLVAFAGVFLFCTTLGFAFDCLKNLSSYTDATFSLSGTSLGLSTERTFLEHVWCSHMGRHLCNQVMRSVKNKGHSTKSVVTRMPECRPKVIVTVTRSSLERFL